MPSPCCRTATDRQQQNHSLMLSTRKTTGNTTAPAGTEPSRDDLLQQGSHSSVLSIPAYDVRVSPTFPPRTVRCRPIIARFLVLPTTTILMPAIMARTKVSELPVDPTAWMIDNEVSSFLLLHQKEVLYMCMVSVQRFTFALPSTSSTFFELTCVLFAILMSPSSI